MSRSDPPTVDIFRAALVMKVRRPLWLEHPEKRGRRTSGRNRFTIAWGEVSGSALRRHHEGGRAASGGRQAQVEEGRLLISTES